MALSAIFCGSTIYYSSKADDYFEALDMSNRRAFSQLLESVSALESGLKKISYASRQPALTVLASQIWQQSEVAKAALSALPLSDARLEKVERFIAQAGDYSYSLLRAMTAGKPAADSDLSSLSGLWDSAHSLSLSLYSFGERLDAGVAAFSPSSGQAPITKSFATVEQEFPQYASLIYDGPFSDHIASRAPAMTENAARVTRDRALSVAADFLDMDFTDLALLSETAGDIPLYCFGDSKDIYIEITKAGGLPYSLINSRALGAATLSPLDAIARAKAYLAAKGFASMEENFYSVYEGVLTVSLAYTENGTTFYPDLMKIGVALDDGSIVRFDSHSYITNHTERAAGAPAITQEQALSTLASNLEVISCSLAVIPTEGMYELLCYEALAAAPDGERVIIYINAENGGQESIFILVETENGVLTI